MQYAQLNQDGSYSHQITTSGNVEWDDTHFCPASALTPEEAAIFGVVPLLETDPPVIDLITQTVMRDGGELVGGQWQYKWRVDDLPAEQVAVNRRALIPQSVTRRQAKQALTLGGLIAGVQPAIDAIPDATQRTLMQIEWDDSQVFERQRPALIQLATALGLDDVALDELFVTAAAL